MTQQPPPQTFSASFILLTYNQQDSVTPAVKAALLQDCTPLEIILSDDASADGTYEVLQTLAKDYTGPHHVVVRRNATNLGINAHLNCLVDCASSDLLIWAAGDDISTPDRAQQIITAHAHSKAQLIFSDAHAVTRDGGAGQALYKKALFYRTTSPLKAATSFALFLGATLATDKRLFQKYGPLPSKRAHEDLILGFRGALEDSIHHIPLPLIHYQEDTGLTGTQTPQQDRMIILQGQCNVLEQRIKDARHFGLSDSDQVLCSMIQSKLRFELRMRYYAPGFGLSWHDIRRPLKLLRALVSEALRARKIRHTTAQTA